MLLLAFAWVTAAAFTWGWLQRHPGPAGALTVAAVLIPATVAYLAVINAVTAYLAFNYAVGSAGAGGVGHRRRLAALAGLAAAPHGVRHRTPPARALQPRAERRTSGSTDRHDPLFANPSDRHPPELTGARS